MKKRILSSLLVLAMTISLVACGGGNTASPTPSDADQSTGDAVVSTEAGEPAASGDKVTITMYSGAADAELTAMETLVNKYNAENTDNIIVELTCPADYEVVLKTMMASNNLPDIFFTHGWAVRRYGEYLYDLSNESWAQYVDDGIRDIITDPNGKLCALPMGQAIEGIQFNSDILAQYNIDPTELDTWDEFVDALRTIKTESNGEIVPMFVAGSVPDILAFFVNSLCGANIGPNETANAQALLANEEFDWNYYGDVLDMFKGLVDEGLVNDGFLTAQVPDMIESVATGKTAFVYLGTSVMEGAAAANPDLNWGFMPYPANTAIGAETPCFINGEQGTYGVWKDGHVAESLKFLEWIAQPENIKYYCETVSKPAGLNNSGVDLSSVNESYNTFAGAKAVGQFDRTYLPNGCWDSVTESTSKYLAGSCTREEAVQIVSDEYARLFGNEAE